MSTTSLILRSERRLGDRFFYFYHTKRRALIKQFVLGRTKRTKRICLVSLIRNEHGRFEPRFEFSTRDTSSSVIESVDEPVRNGETRTIKARVDLKDCHENLWRLIGYLEGVEGIELPASRFHLVPESQADLAKALQGAPRAEAIAAVKASLQGITEEEIALLSGRKASLTEFEVLLHDEGRFEAARRGLGDNKRAEDVWQDFFERNQWIFGYGLKLVSLRRARHGEAPDNYHRREFRIWSWEVDGRVDAHSWRDQQPAFLRDQDTGRKVDDG